VAATKRSFLGRLLRLPRVLAGDAADLVEALVRHWPGSLGYGLRTRYYRKRLKHLGKGVVIDPGVRFLGLKHISIGDGTHIYFECIICAGPAAPNQAEVRRLSNEHFAGADGEVHIGRGVHMAAGCYILGNGGVQIGDYCGLAGGTRILSMTYHYASFADRSRRDVYFGIEGGTSHACYLFGPVVLGDNVGVASNVVLLPGATVCNDSFVTIGSVVHPGVIPPNSIASGNPAALVKQRFTPPRSSE
jgi:acetyltransferase-like isoleucine patch superfamily enzyme